MKTIPKYPPRQRNTKELLTILMLAALLLAAVMSLASCTVTWTPDGSKSATVNGEQVLRAIEIIATK